MAETELYERILSNHMNTLDRASERVSSWPQWKRDTIQYRSHESIRPDVATRDEDKPKRQR